MRLTQRISTIGSNSDRVALFSLIVIFLLTILLATRSANGQTSVAWTQATTGVSIAVDPANNVFTIYYDSNLGGDITLTKRDVNGNFLWQSSYNQTDPTKWERAQWVTTDSQGNAIVCGTLMSGYSNPVIAASTTMKFSPSGALLWRVVFDGPFDGSSTHKCIVDAQDDIYVLGIGSGPSGLVTRVRKFSPTGAVIWDYFDTDGIGAPQNIKIGKDQNLLIVAKFVTGNYNGYLKITPTGTRLWGLTLVPSATAGDLAGDSFGNTYLVHGLNSGAPATCIVKKLDPLGTQVFSLTYPTGGTRIEVGTDEQAVVGGLPNSGSFGAAFFKIDPFGNQLWINQDADGPSFALLLHAQMLIDASNDVYLAAGTLFQMAVCKINSNGSTGWTVGISGSGYANGIALGRHDRSIFVVGGQTARILDASESPWTDLGSGTAGTYGIPLLYGEGSFVGGTTVTLSVEKALENVVSAIVVGGFPVNSQVYGGFLVPSPDLIVYGVTPSIGPMVASAVWPAGFPSGVNFYFQSWFVDPTGPQGFVASNALRATTP